MIIFIGQGIDRHRLTRATHKTTIKLGGARIESNYDPVAVSDGDVVLHALSNAILGSIQMGDIGQYFSDQDLNNQDLDSSKILYFALKQLEARKLVINNIDLTIICENIHLQKYKHLIQNRIIELTRCTYVNVKATRYETQSDMIECHCCILVK